HEVPLDQVERSLRRVARHRGPRPPTTTNSTGKPELPHQPFNRAARHSNALSVQLPPDFTRAIDLEILLPDPLDLLSEHRLSPRPSRAERRIALPGLAGVVRRWSDRQHAADRLDSIPLPVRVDERHHHPGRRSSSAWAKKAAALRRISLARRSSRFSRSSSLIRSRSAVVGPGRLPRSRSACRTQLRSVSPEQPIFAAIDWMAAHCDAYSRSCSNTSRTARSRTSGEYFFACLMTPISQELESPANPGRFRPLRRWACDSNGTTTHHATQASPAGHPTSTNGGPSHRSWPQQPSSMYVPEDRRSGLVTSRQVDAHARLESCKWMTPSEARPRSAAHDQRCGHESIVSC